MNGVEEGGQPAHVVKLAGKGGGKIEAEAIDVHLGHPVAERVHDHLEDGGIADVESVAGAGVVHVVTRIILHKAVVGGVANALPTEHGAQVVAFAGVVIHHVENDLDAGGVESFDHLLNSRTWPPWSPDEL